MIVRVLSWWISLILILGFLIVAYMVLFERKVLRRVQLRKGPNVNRWRRVLQTLYDRIKLLTKELNVRSFWLSLREYSPLIRFIGIYTFSYIFWYNRNTGTVISGWYVVVITSVRSFTVLVSGWASVSNYGILGSIRRLAIILCYETVLFAILWFKSEIHQRRNWLNWRVTRSGGTRLAIGIVWSVIALVETGRTPFDLVEGESELVSGYSVEFRRRMFTVLFLSEYMRSWIIYCWMIIYYIWRRGNNSIRVIIIVWISFNNNIIRASFPRMKFTEVITIFWRRITIFILSWGLGQWI
jgi:NADH:ubiquinone oxidoreductase subunit H